MGIFQSSFIQGVSKAEVHQALKGMKSYKALGLDGFQAIFF